MDAEPGDPHDKLVLVVDDDDAMRELLEALLTIEGFRVELAADGKEGLEKAKTANPDLVVLDLMLPGKAGYDVLHELQAEGLGGVPVVVVTGRALDHKLKDMLKFESNVRDVVQKPLPQIFAKRLHALLNTRPPATA